MQVSQFEEISTDAMKGAVIMCPTDTTYGFSARVTDVDAITRIRKLKGRDAAQAMLVLICDIGQLSAFAAEITASHRYLFEKVWPGPVTIVLSVSSHWKQVAAADGTVAFRIPEYPELRDFIRRVGPLVSTSANRTGEGILNTVEEAVPVFGDQIDIYVNAGPKVGTPSTIVRVVR